MLKDLKIIAIAVAGIIASITAGNFRSKNLVHAADKPKVVASHNIICDLVETIARETVDLTCLMNPNQDPHTYRPTPSQRKAMEEAQLIIYGGYQLEPKITKLLEATNAETPKIALYEQVVTEPITIEHQHEHKSESSTAKPEPELAPDPHVWHNVENTVAMVELLESIFLQANPSEAQLYLTNSNALTEQFWQLDAWIKDRVATIPEGQRVLVTTHDSLHYYTQAYSLNDYKTLQGLSAASPTASQVRDLVTEIEQTGVPTIFAESTASDRVINNVARAADVELSPEELYVDGLGETANYIEMMSHNICAIVNGLGGECQPFAAAE
jgi:ABC-type Zn uptake system ZnuABC Zn-binding protein ZnuA